MRAADPIRCSHARLGFESAVHISPFLLIPGTIFNEILVWKALVVPAQLLVSRGPYSPAPLDLESPAEGVPAELGGDHCDLHRLGRRMEALHTRLDAAEAAAKAAAKNTGGGGAALGWAEEVGQIRGRQEEERRQRSACYLPLPVAAGSSPAPLSCQPQPKGSASGDPSCLILQARPAYRCVGHEGSVFCVSWDESGGRLVSTSDDRTARVWELPHHVRYDTTPTGRNTYDIMLQIISTRMRGAHPVPSLAV